MKAMTNNYTVKVVNENLMLYSEAMFSEGTEALLFICLR
jgi:hypothetical protein